MRDSYIVGIIGAGNMGEALIKGLLRSQLVRSYEVIASAKTRSRIHSLEKNYGIHTTLNNKVIMNASDTIILAVKPQNFEELSAEIKDEVTSDHLLISIAAGIDMQMLGKLFGKKPKLIRVMPNLPALVDQGVSAIYCAPKMAERYRRFAHQIFQAVGTTANINNEQLMDVITGVSGTGPAYIFALMEGMIQAGIKGGLKPKVAQDLVKQTALGSAILASQAETDPKGLRERVTSKQGTTWAAMNVFKKRKFWDVVEGGVNAATNRAKQLRKTKNS